MKLPNNPVVYTIGHSNHRLEDVIAMLRSFSITNLADIRRLPGSRKFPQFDQEHLVGALAEHGIRYEHLSELGGRRKVQKDSRCNSQPHICVRRPYGGGVEVYFARFSSALVLLMEGWDERKISYQKQ